MKKSILLFLLVLSTASVVSAKQFIIKVSDFQFTPSTVNVKLGDTIIWKWVNGTHTTSSLVIPKGAKAWNKPIDATHKNFGYRVTKVGIYNYQCNIHASIMKGTINVSAASAVDVADFIISDDNGSPLLSWNTSVSVANDSYFSIQRSTNASQFTEVVKVNTNVTNRYSFTDKNLPSTKYLYYQVVLINSEGNKLLSPIQMFYNKNSAAMPLITSLRPNPVSGSGHLMLQFNADKEGTLLARLYNQSGNLLKQEELSAVKGLNNGHFMMGSLSPGTYYIIFTLGNISEKHLVVVK